VTNRRRTISKEQPGRFSGALSFGVAPLGYAVIRQTSPIHDATKFGWRDCLLGKFATAGGRQGLSRDLQHERQPEGITLSKPFRPDLLHQPF
jgi:hypothetical protein